MEKQSLASSNTRPERCSPLPGPPLRSAVAARVAAKRVDINHMTRSYKSAGSCVHYVMSLDSLQKGPEKRRTAATLLILIGMIHRLDLINRLELFQVLWRP